MNQITYVTYLEGVILYLHILLADIFQTLGSVSKNICDIFSDFHIFFHRNNILTSDIIIFLCPVWNSSFIYIFHPLS